MLFFAIVTMKQVAPHFLQILVWLGLGAANLIESATILIAI
jgi:hypothetical protein